jgi:hypothetical protein
LNLEREALNLEREALNLEREALNLEQKEQFPKIIFFQIVPSNIFIF